MVYGGLDITLMLQELLHFLYVSLHIGNGGENWFVIVMRKSVGEGPHQLDHVLSKTMGGGS